MGCNTVAVRGASMAMSSISRLRT
nr:hypothetical protein [Tanacetum cinerariifolium]